MIALERVSGEAEETTGVRAASAEHDSHITIDGIEPDALRKYERGEVEPKMTALKLMAAYYHITLDELCKTEDE